MALRTRTHGFTAWINLRLLQPGQPLLSNVLTDLLNGTNMVKLLNSFTGTAGKKIGKLDGLSSAQKHNRVKKLIRVLKKNGVIPEDVFVDNRLFAMRSADHVFDLLWRLVCHDIWFVWKQGATILRNETQDLLLIKLFTWNVETNVKSERRKRNSSILTGLANSEVIQNHIESKITDDELKTRCENPEECVIRNPACLPSPESCILDMVATQLKMTSEGRRLNCRTLLDLGNSHVLCALLNAFVPEVFTLECLINDRWTTNLVLRTIEDMFEISSPFNAEDFIEGDKMSICAYFCFFFMMACRYRQCRAVTEELEHIKRVIYKIECLIENTMDSNEEQTSRTTYQLQGKLRILTKKRKILEDKSDPQRMSEWIQHVESVKKKTLNIVRQKMEEKYETVNVPRDVTIARLCQATGINLSLTTGYGYYLCQTPEIVTESRDIVLKDKITGKFIPSNQNNKRKIRTSIGLELPTPSQLYPSKYPEYEIYLESTSKNRQLPHGCTFFYQIFPSSDIPWKQRFLKAAKENESDTVLRMAMFFKQEPDFINWKEPKSGNTALHYACRYGNMDTVNKLLECNADFDCQNKNLCTPLHLAVTSRHRAIIHLLIEWGCDVSLKNDKQQTAIEIAKIPHLKEFIIKTYNQYLEPMSAIMNGDSDLLLRLIKSHINKRGLFCSLSSRCVSGSTLLHTAVHWGDTESMDYLLQLGIDPDIRDYKGATPLHRARDCASAAILLEEGAKVDAEDHDGNTPLHIKCYELEEESSNLEVISYLIKRGADITKRNKTGLLPIHCSAMQGRTDVIEYQFEEDAESRIAHALMEEPLLPSLMFLALTGGFLSCAHWLLENGFRMLEGEPEKLLFEIVSKSFKISDTDDILSFLLEYGVDVNSQFQRNNTALHYVCSLGASEFALKGLLERGAKIEMLNDNSMTPLMVATKSNNLQAAAILIQAGANMMEENEDGKCALDVVQDPEDWIKCNQFSERTKETVTAHSWQEARILIQELTAKVRPGAEIKPMPVDLYSNPYSHNHRGPLAVTRLPNIFIT